MSTAASANPPIVSAKPPLAAAGGGGDGDANGQQKIKAFLDSIVEVNTSSSSEMAVMAAKSDDGSHHHSDRISHSSVFSARSPKVHTHHQRPPTRSKSTDQDDTYLENVTNAKDRRVSWLHNRKDIVSFAPSLSVICEYTTFC